MSEKNLIKNLIDSAEKKLNESKADDALRDLNRLDEMGSEDARLRLFQAVAMAMLGKKDEARRAAIAAQDSSRNVLAEAEKLLARLK